MNEKMSKKEKVPCGKAVTSMCVSWREVASKKVEGVIWSCGCTCIDYAGASIEDPDGQHDTFYLADKNTGDIILYVDRATDMKVTTDATGANVWSLNGDGVHDAADLMATGNEALIAAASGKNVAAHKISSITMTKTSSDSNARNLMVTFTMDGDPEFDFEGGKPSPHSEGGTDSYSGFADHIVARATNNNDVDGWISSSGVLVIL